MIRAVYDCNVILSGIGWNGSARKCLKLVAERRVFLFVTDEILSEYEAVCLRRLYRLCASAHISSWCLAIYS